MLVFGKRPQEIDPRELLETILRGAGGLARVPAGLERHASLVELLIDAGSLAQALADDATSRDRDESDDEATRAAVLLARAAARAVVRSFRDGFDAPLHLDWSGAALPTRARVNPVEGYMLYAVYPEAYLLVADRLAGRGFAVIGIRSAGTSLGAVVAESCRADSFVTVRPVGHPYDRHVRASESLRARLTARSGVAIVDEGPGLSGSSFGSVADLVESVGIPSDRIVFFPAHGNPVGPFALERHRRRWERALKLPAPTDALLTRPDSPLWVGRLFEDVVGRAESIEDISAGRWRALHFGDSRHWPAVALQQERRKFRLRAGGRWWLLKFAGLGRHGRERLAIARALAEAGFAPRVHGLRHGFLLYEWRDDARAGCAAGPGFVDHLAAYFAFRASTLPGGAGASADELLAMARHNASSMGASGWLSRFDAVLPRARRLPRIAVDARLLPHEWLALREGGWLKVDGEDHFDAHDLVGCQPLAWDIAGAEVELGINRFELLGALARSGIAPVEPDVLAFYRVCYLAFRLGHCALAAASSSPDEAQRLERDGRRYAELLRREEQRWCGRR